MTFILCLILCSMTLVQAQDMDTELSNLATNLASTVKAQGKKKIAVIDFTDLEGGSSDLGKYVAEQLTVDLVMARQDFSVLDRANLKRILAEHKLTAIGLVDPDNAKKLGQFAGVDALILGTLTPINHNIVLTVKVITTDTAEIVGAAKAQFKSDDGVQQLLSRQTDDSSQSDALGTSTKETPKLSKFFGNQNIRLDILSLRVVDGKDYLLTANFVNLNTNRTWWLALVSDGISLNSVVTDSEGYQFEASERDLSGVGAGHAVRPFGLLGNSSQIGPRETLSLTLKFSSLPGRIASPGMCSVNLNTILLEKDGYNRFSAWQTYNLVGKIKVE